MEIECKDLRTVRFDFIENASSTADAQKVAFFDKLNNAAFGKLETLFCFQPPVRKTPHPWHIYDPKEEFDRQTIPLGEKCEWELSSANEHFTICETYPKQFVVPRRHGDLAKVAAYRTRSRLPVLSWIHPETGAALLRSSQPTIGITEKKSVDDYEYLKQVRDLRFVNYIMTPLDDFDPFLPLKLFIVT